MAASEIERIQERLGDFVKISRERSAEGKVASYIPELSKMPKDALGIVIMDAEGRTAEAGDTGIAFTMQSISKVFSLILALMDNGEEAVFRKVGMEPTGDNYNSLMKLELVKPGIPFNPLINAGAIAVCSLIAGGSPREKAERVLAFYRRMANNPALEVDQSVYESEAATANLNRSIAYLLKDNGVLEGDVEDALEVYFRQCSVSVTCRDIARMGLVLASGGMDPIRGEQIVPRRYVQIAKTFMTTCGMYNASGEFAIEAGLPAKSGVSGGILALVPGKYGIGAVGPALNAKGNSIAAVHLLTTLSQEFDWSMF
jgi:glutaminase